MKALIATIWLFGIPKTPVDLVSIYPATTFAVTHYIAFRGRWNAYLIALALGWDLCIGFWLMVGVMLRPRRALFRTLRELKNCSYHPIKLRDLLTPEQRRIVEQSSLLEYLKTKGLPWQHDRDVEIFRVEMGESGWIPPGPAAFNVPFFGGYLLIRDDFSQADARERFSLWHELGHTLDYEFALQSTLWKGIKSPFISFALALLLVDWTLRSIATAGMTLVALMVLKRVLGHLRSSWRLQSEIKADRFALQFLNGPEIEDLRSRASKHVPEDRDLSKSEHRIRKALFQDALINGDLTEVGVINLPGFTLDFALAGLNLTGWIVLLAMQIRPLEARDLNHFSWCVLALAGLGMVRYVQSYLLAILIDLTLAGRMRWDQGRIVAKASAAKRNQ